jgi:hypothetical protein
MFLRTVTAKNAPGHKAEIWAELMKLYSRAKGIYGGTEYANQRENKRVNLQQPHAVLYGMTTPSTFWGALEGGALVDGSLARFLVFITDDHRPPRNHAPAMIEPSEALVAALQAVAAGPEAPSEGNLSGAAHMLATVPLTAHTVPMTEGAGLAHRGMLASEEDAWALKVAGTPQAAIVNRLGENAAKLALVRAVSDDPAHPVISEADVRWGWALALHCTKALLENADRHIADNDHERRVNKALEIIRKRGASTVRELWHAGLKLPARDTQELLRTLVEVGVLVAIQVATGPEGGRPTVRYGLVIK